jgi:hypothetical protein
MKRHATVLSVLVLLLAGSAASLPAQAPPRPVAPPVQAQPAVATPPSQAPAEPGSAPTSQPPSEATLGVPFYPAMAFIESYDAGSGQRFFLFGTSASFADVVAYYRSALKQRGELVFEEPATHMFEIGRFREETMTFPPSVTVKDYTWGGMQGYPNPRPGAEPVRFQTVVQVVPIPATAPDVKR